MFHSYSKVSLRTIVATDFLDRRTRSDNGRVTSFRFRDPRATQESWPFFVVPVKDASVVKDGLVVKNQFGAPGVGGKVPEAFVAHRNNYSLTLLIQEDSIFHQFLRNLSRVCVEALEAKFPKENIPGIAVPLARKGTMGESLFVSFILNKEAKILTYGKSPLDFRSLSTFETNPLPRGCTISSMVIAPTSAAVVSPADGTYPKLYINVHVSQVSVYPPQTSEQRLTNMSLDSGAASGLASVLMTPSAKLIELMNKVQAEAEQEALESIPQAQPMGDGIELPDNLVRALNKEVEERKVKIPRKGEFKGTVTVKGNHLEHSNLLFDDAYDSVEEYGDNGEIVIPDSPPQMTKGPAKKPRTF